MPSIDIHTHFMPREYLDLLHREGGRHGVEVVRSDSAGPIIMYEGHPFGPIDDVFFDAEKRIVDMDAQRVDVHCLSLSPPMVYWAGAELGLELARVFNDGAAKAASTYPTRFIAIATLPMQDVPAAVAEGERAVKELGMQGFYLGTNVLGKYLDHEDFWPVFELAQSLGVPVFVHPLRVVGAERMEEFYLHNSIGNPTETALTISRMLYSGVPAQFPDLKLCFAHAGGSFPYLVGRLDRTYKMRKECQHLAQPPSSYLKNITFDTITHHPAVLEFLIKSMGPDKVLMGSDYPFDMGDDDPMGSVEAVPGLAQPDRERIISGNALNMLGLKIPSQIKAASD